MSKIITLDSGKLFASNPAVSLGAYSRVLRDSNYSLFTSELQQVYGYVPESTRLSELAFFEESSTSGTITVSNSKKVFDLPSTGWITTQFNYGLPYQGGLFSRLVFTANFNPNSNSTATTKYIGLFTGIPPAITKGILIGYTENTDTFFVRYTGISTTSINQSSWDDPLDGTGSSGCILNSSEPNTFFIDFDSEHFINFGVFIDEDPIIFHTIYLRTATGVDLSNLYVLPFRVLLDGAGSTDLDFYGFSYYLNSDLNTYQTRSIGQEPFNLDDLDAPTDGVIYPILGMRQKVGSAFVAIKLSTINVMSTTGSNFWYGLFKNPTYDTGTVMAGLYESIIASNIEFNNDSSATQEIISPTSLALFQHFVANNQDQSIFDLDNYPLVIIPKLDGSFNEYVLGVAKLGGATESFFSAITFREYL